MLLSGRQSNQKSNLHRDYNPRTPSLDLKVFGISHPYFLKGISFQSWWHQPSSQSPSSERQLSLANAWADSQQLRGRLRWAKWCGLEGQRIKSCCWLKTYNFEISGYDMVSIEHLVSIPWSSLYERKYIYAFSYRSTWKMYLISEWMQILSFCSTDCQSLKLTATETCLKVAPEIPVMTNCCSDNREAITIYKW